MWILFFIFNGINCLKAQRDPFAPTPNSQTDAAALSPSEIPTIEQYISSPENIKVSRIDPQLLTYALNDNAKVFLLDARTKEEFDVSHVLGARLVGYEDFSVERVWMIDRKARVVVYSANNIRGTVIAQYLKLMGFLDVELLEEGLIGWKNAGLKVFNAKGETDRVHVGPKENARLLKIGVVVY